MRRPGKPKLGSQKTYQRGTGGTLRGTEATSYTPTASGGFLDLSTADGPCAAAQGWRAAAPGREASR